MICGFRSRKFPVYTKPPAKNRKAICPLERIFMNTEHLKLGKSIGRGQAFAVTAQHSLLAEARCWKRIHDSGEYKMTGLTWDDFCVQEIGLSRQHVEGLIARLEELGETYCQLSAIVPISAEVYQAMRHAIADNTIEIDGEAVPIVPENAPRIRAAVLQARSDLRAARKRPVPDPVAAIHTRLEGCVGAISRLSGKIEPADREKVRSLVDDSVLRLMALSENLAA